MPWFDIKEVLATIQEMVEDGHKYVSLDIIDGDGDPRSLWLSGRGDDPMDGEVEYDSIDEVDID